MASADIRLPPGPRAPAVVQIWRWVFSPVAMMENCARQYGDWFTVRFPKGLSVVFTSEPEAVKDVFAGDPDKLHAGEGNIIFKPLLGEQSLLVLDGPEHRRARRLMMPPFHGDRMKAYGTRMSQITRSHARRWPRGRRTPLHVAMQEITLDVILTTIFGLAEGERLERLRDLLTTLIDANSGEGNFFRAVLMLNKEGKPPLARLPPSLGRLTPWGRFMKLRREIDAIVLAEIAERRKSSENRDDVLSLLISARDQEGGHLNDAELRDEMMTLLVAGHETSATTLCWIFLRLAENPAVLSRLQAELNTAFGSGPVAPEKIMELPYLDAVISETLRLNPIVPLVWRLLKAPLRLGSRELPAGVAIAPCAYLMHRRAALWPNAEVFDPERFLGAKPAPWEYFPFGGGGRRCLGMAFALYEMKIVAAEMIRAVSITPIPGYNPRTVRRGVTFAPSEGLPVLIESLAAAAPTA
jgi:cytochrome P450